MSFQQLSGLILVDVHAPISTGWFAENPPLEKNEDKGADYRPGAEAAPPARGPF
jgi:hypothetical protein